MTMPFHRFHQRRDQRLQTLAANPIGCFPEHDQRLANRIIVYSAVRAWPNPPTLLSAAKQTSGMFAVEPRHRHKLVQDPATLGGWLYRAVIAATS